MFMRRLEPSPTKPQIDGQPSFQDGSIVATGIDIIASPDGFSRLERRAF